MINGSSQSFQGGISAGLNAARIDGDSHDLYGKLGLNAGAFIVRPVMPDILYWQMEIKYTSRGKYNLQRDQLGYIIGMELIDLRYVEFPFSLQFFFNDKFQIELGFSPDLLLKEYYADENGSLSPEFSNDLRRFGITAFGGLNYFVFEAFSLGVRFNYSAIPFYKFEAYAIRYRDSGWFHDVLSLNVRYYFSR
jgi:hypothetical protein